MNEANLVLEDKLRERIRRDGPVTYETFLDVVLYDEEQGYYRNGKRPRKDYFTSPEIHPIFGKIIGKYVEDIRLLRGPGTVTVIELGGASGLLADQILSGVARRDDLDYIIVENGRKEEADGVRWVSDLKDVTPMKGLAVVIANEFFDALPFHRLVRTENGLEEIYVDLGDGFVERRGPLTPQLKSFLSSCPLALNLHQSAEVTIRASQMLSRLNDVVEEALLLVFDYGYHAEELALGRFPDGSVTGYKDFVIRQDLLRNLGSVDITHHVNFDHLGTVLNNLGWRKPGEIEQYRFLINIGMLEQIMTLPDAERIAAKNLINPQGLGSMISVLGFTKNLLCDVPGFSSKRFL
jgi:SAM-dependent MidA family methyltransferase